MVRSFGQLARRKIHFPDCRDNRIGLFAQFYGLFIEARSGCLAIDGLAEAKVWR
jgi:hypothetical protein